MTRFYIHEDDRPRDCLAEYCDEGWINSPEGRAECSKCNGTGRLGREGHEPEIEVKCREHRSLGWDNHGWYWRTHHRPPDAGWQLSYGQPYPTEVEALTAAREALG